MLFSVVLVVVCTGALSSPVSNEENIHDNIVLLRDGAGSIHELEVPSSVDIKLLNEIQRNPDNTAYWLYTRDNPDEAQILKHGDENSITASNFNPEKRLIVIAHGWLGTGSTQPNTIIRKAYFEKFDVNIVTIDYRRLALSDYTTALLGAPAVGEGVGQFINWLHSTFGVQYENVHLVGFDLGAHLLGHAGRATGGKVARITGLDPCGPIEEHTWISLSPTDAVYVEAIHTDGNGYGIGMPVAQIDFYVNGGRSQPGCFTNLCNHNRVYELFASSLIYDHFYGYKCSSTTVITWITCTGESLRMGNDELTKSGSSGVYRVDTASRYPY